MTGPSLQFLMTFLDQLRRRYLSNRSFLSLIVEPIVLFIAFPKVAFILQPRYQNVEHELNRI